MAQQTVDMIIYNFTILPHTLTLPSEGMEGEGEKDMREVQFYLLLCCYMAQQTVDMTVTSQYYHTP